MSNKAGVKLPMPSVWRTLFNASLASPRLGLAWLGLWFATHFIFIFVLCAASLLYPPPPLTHCKCEFGFAVCAHAQLPHAASMASVAAGHLILCMCMCGQCVCVRVCVLAYQLSLKRLPHMTDTLLQRPSLCCVVLLCQKCCQFSVMRSIYST